MSFHGGFARHDARHDRCLPGRAASAIWTLFDVIAAGVPVGLGLVRMHQLHQLASFGAGRPTCPGRSCSRMADPSPRHPSQLYEALLEGLVLFLLLRFLTHCLLKLKTPGFVSGAFVAGYGLSRIFVEFFREPDQQLGYLLGGWLTMGMVLSLPMVLVGIWAMATARRRTPAPSPA